MAYKGSRSPCHPRRTDTLRLVCTVALRGLARPAAQTPLFRRRRGRRPGHDCRVIYAVLPARPFFLFFTACPNVNLRAGRRRPHDTCSLGASSKATYARRVRICITFILETERALGCQLKSLDTGKSRRVRCPSDAGRHVPHWAAAAPPATARRKSDTSTSSLPPSRSSAVRPPLGAEL